MRAIAVDLPGFGGSSSLGRAASIGSYADFLDAFCERLDLGKVHLVGNSMGGLVAMDVAVRYPDRVRSVSLIGGTPRSILAFAQHPVKGLLERPGVALTVAWEVLTGALPPPAWMQREIAARPRLRWIALRFAVRRPADISAESVMDLLEGVGKAGFVPAVLAHRRHDYQESAREAGCPVLVVAGSDDLLIPLADAEDFVRDAANANLEVVDAVGHLPMLEAPATVSRLLVGFIERN
jgi:pimeloyl-ACP methyl ester carboxylesterase